MQLGREQSYNNTLLRRVLRGSLPVSASWKGSSEAPVRVFSKDKVLRRVLIRERFIEGA